MAVPILLLCPTVPCVTTYTDVMEKDCPYPCLPELTAQLGADHLHPLLDRLTLMELSPGEALLRDQQPIDSFYLVLEGKLTLSVEVNSHAIHMGEIEPGNWVGYLSYFSGNPLSASTVTATADTLVARLTHADYEAVLKDDPVAVCRLTHAFILMMIRRLHVTANNPIIDTHGEMLFTGDLSVPWSDLAQHKHSVVDFLKTLFGAR